MIEVIINYWKANGHVMEIAEIFVKVWEPCLINNKHALHQ